MFTHVKYIDSAMSLVENHAERKTVLSDLLENVSLMSCEGCKKGFARFSGFVNIF